MNDNTKMYRIDTGPYTFDEFQVGVIYGIVLGIHEATALYGGEPVCYISDTGHTIYEFFCNENVIQTIVDTVQKWCGFRTITLEELADK